MTAVQQIHKKDFSKVFIETVTTALGTVAALTWADAIKTLFAKDGMFATTSRLAPWYVALAATCLAVWGSRALWLASKRIAARERKHAQFFEGSTAADD